MLKLYPEEWKPIKGFEGCYSVSNYGRVKSESRVVPKRNGTTMTVKERFLSSGTERGWYVTVDLKKEGKSNFRYVHRLVAEAFIPNPKNLPEVNHDDGNKQNNHKHNLIWTTTKGNGEHASRIGLLKNRRPGNVKLTPAQIQNIKVRLAKGERVSKLAAEHTVSLVAIYNIRNGKSWSKC